MHLLEALNAGDDDLCAEVLEYLATISDVPTDVATRCHDALGRAILSADPGVRYWARKLRTKLAADGAQTAAGGNGEAAAGAPTTEGVSSAAAEILLMKLKLGSRYIVFDAIERLTGSRDAALLPELLKFLSNETDPYKLSYIVKRLGRIRDRRVTEALLPYLKHPDTRVVANTLEGLAMLGDGSGVPEARELVDAADNRVRANAIKLLWSQDREAAEEALADMLAADQLFWQDSALYVMESVGTDHDPRLVDLARQSRFPAIRMRALTLRARGGTDGVTVTAKPAGAATEPGELQVPMWRPVAVLIAAAVAHFAPFDATGSGHEFLVGTAVAVMALLFARRVPGTRTVALVLACVAALYAKVGGLMGFFALILVLSYEALLESVPRWARPQVPKATRMAWGVVVVMVFFLAWHHIDAFNGLQPVAQLARLLGSHDEGVLDLTATYQQYIDQTFFLVFMLTLVAVGFGALSAMHPGLKGRERFIPIALGLGAFLLVVQLAGFTFRRATAFRAEGTTSVRPWVQRLAVPVPGDGDSQSGSASPTGSSAPVASATPPIASGTDTR